MESDKERDAFKADTIGILWKNLDHENCAFLGWKLGRTQQPAQGDVVERGMAAVDAWIQSTSNAGGFTFSRDFMQHWTAFSGNIVKAALSAMPQKRMSEGEIADIVRRVPVHHGKDEANYPTVTFCSIDYAVRVARSLLAAGALQQEVNSAAFPHGATLYPHVNCAIMQTNLQDRIAKLEGALREIATTSQATVANPITVMRQIASAALTEDQGAK